MRWAPTTIRKLKVAVRVDPTSRAKSMTTESWRETKVPAKRTCLWLCKGWSTELLTHCRTLWQGPWKMSNWLLKASWELPWLSA